VQRDARTRLNEKALRSVASLPPDEQVAAATAALPGFAAHVEALALRAAV